MANKLALITGASSGIGLYLAQELAGRGYDIVMANDVWGPACQTYESNLGSGKIECGDAVHEQRDEFCQPG